VKNLKSQFAFWREGVDGQKIANIFLSSIFTPTHHFLYFCLFFLSVPAEWVQKCCGGKLGGQFGQFIAKSLL
jgi:hypothetical protein